MVYKDGGEFTTYCDKPYDRHNYAVILKDGREYVFDSYKLARDFWWSFCKKGIMDRIEVLDVKKGRL